MNYNEALRLFGLTDNFTKEELKKDIWNYLKNIILI